jgi:integrase
MARKPLTSKFVESAKAIPASGRKDWHDAVVPGLALRAGSGGHRSYVLVARYPLHPRNPTRRTLGDAGALTLEKAREKARRWLELILTGQRERECAGMLWDEIDFDKALWTIPASRMKSDRAHAVPLAPDALALLQALPRFIGPFAFTSDERKATNSFAKIKAKIDAMTGISGWVLHDLRRTMRSGLSALPIEDRVREAMVAHAQPGLHAVYSIYDWLPEKRRGFELWEQRLRGILAPKPPADLADIAAERGRRVA